MVFQNHLFEGVCIDALTFIVTKHHLLWLRLQSSDLIALLPIGTLAVVALLLRHFSGLGLASNMASSCFAKRLIK